MVWKRIFKDISLLLLAAGVFAGLYFASYDWDKGKFSGYSFVLWIIVSLVVTYFSLQFFWWIKRRRGLSSPSKIYKVLSLRKADLVSDKERHLQDKIIPIIEQLGSNTIRTIDSLYPRVIFEFPKEHKYGFMYQNSIEVISSKEHRFSSVLKDEYPIALSIRRRSVKSGIKNETLQISSSEFFTFNSTHSIFYEEILKKKEINSILEELKDSLEQLSFNGRFISGKITLFENVDLLLQLVSLIHDIVMLKDFGDMEIEQLVCYQCGDPFEITEGVCTSCKAPRPSCIVCLLDMKPSEKKKVVQTPCCGVYAHRDHIISWLETDSTCPNCKKDMFLWLRKLKQTIK